MEWAHISVILLLSVCSLQQVFGESEASSPLVRYAQRKGLLMLTVEVSSVADEWVQINNSSMKFSGKGVGFQNSKPQLYTLDLEFYKSINHAESNYTIHPRNVQFFLQKHESGPYWPHILKDGAKPQNLVIDWNNWIREETDGVKWNDLADRKWEWWEPEDDDDEDEDTEDDLSDLYPGLQEKKDQSESGEGGLPHGMKMATPENFAKAVKGEL